MTPLIEPHDPKHPDMSPEAIDDRLRELGRLYKLGMALKNPTWVWRGNIAESEAATRQGDSLAITTGELAPFERRDRNA
ncbi:MAG: hypothetical protein H7062_07810 [Candidatus Saccharimonas sp.]|nr:hypothetical protein [Planctomycetaceae bacterium]